MNKNRYWLVALALCLSPLCKADTIYSFSLDTAPLAGNGPFTLDLQFLAGGGAPNDLNLNTIALSGFTFGGGAPLGGGTATGGASGSLASGVTLTDSAFFNEYYENFTPGTLLSFTIDSTNAPSPSGTPDLFTVAILDSHGNELPTNGPASEFLDVSLAGGSSSAVTTYGSAPGSALALPAPVVQSQTRAVIPEPASYWEMLAALTAIAVGRRVSKAGYSQ